MNLPTLAALAVTVLGEDTAVTVGLVVIIVTLALALGESRWQVSSLREWKHTASAEIAALKQQHTAMEVREGRTATEILYMRRQLDKIEEGMEKLLSRNINTA